jgi:hypothetical protein
MQPSESGAVQRSIIKKAYCMAGTTMGQITIVYRGETQQFATVSLATHFLRQDWIKMGWFHKITATVDLIGDDQIRQTQHLKGDKFDIMKALVQLEGDIKSSKA